jgi:hypothetical protein
MAKDGSNRGNPTDFESFLTWEALTEMFDREHLGEFARRA